MSKVHGNWDNVSNLDSLIETYSEAKLKLSEALAAEDFEKIRVSDYLVVDTFNTILKFEPSRYAESNRLVALLLDELIPTQEETHLSAAIKEKILTTIR